MAALGRARTARRGRSPAPLRRPDRLRRLPRGSVGRGRAAHRAGCCCSSTPTTARATTRACSASSTPPNSAASASRPTTCARSKARTAATATIAGAPTPDAIPSTWRRWPVDLVAVPNEAHDDGYRMVVTPEELRRHSSTAARRSPRRGPTSTGAAPFSWRGALYVVDSVLRELGQPAAASGVAPAQREALDSPGLCRLARPRASRPRAGVAERRRGRDPAPRKNRCANASANCATASPRSPRNGAQQLDRLAAFIVDHPNGAAIAKRIDSDARSRGRMAQRRRRAAWRDPRADRRPLARQPARRRPTGRRCAMPSTATAIRAGRSNGPAATATFR